MCVIDHQECVTQALNDIEIAHVFEELLKLPKEALTRESLRQKLVDAVDSKIAEIGEAMERAKEEVLQDLEKAVTESMKHVLHVDDFIGGDKA